MGACAHFAGSYPARVLFVTAIRAGAGMTSMSCGRLQLGARAPPLPDFVLLSPVFSLAFPLQAKRENIKTKREKGGVPGGAEDVLGNPFVGLRWLLQSHQHVW